MSLLQELLVMSSLREQDADSPTWTTQEFVERLPAYAAAMLAQEQRLHAEGDPVFSKSEVERKRSILAHIQQMLHYEGCLLSDAAMRARHEEHMAAPVS